MRKLLTGVLVIAILLSVFVWGYIYFAIRDNSGKASMPDNYVPQVKYSEPKTPVVAKQETLFNIKLLEFSELTQTKVASMASSEKIMEPFPGAPSLGRVVIGIFQQLTGGVLVLSKGKTLISVNLLPGKSFYIYDSKTDRVSGKEIIDGDKIAETYMANSVKLGNLVVLANCDQTQNEQVGCKSLIRVDY